MVGIGENLKTARKELGISQRELGKRVGLTQTAISELEAGRATSTPKIHEIAKVLNVTPEWLEGSDTSVPKPKQRNVTIAPGDFPGSIEDFGGREFARIPVYDVRFSAGFGAENDNETPIDYHEIGMPMLRRYTSAPIEKLAFLQVNGDSMEPLLFNKDWVLVDSTRTSLASPAIYAIVCEGEGFLKHASKNLETGAVTLVSHNPAYPPQTITKTDALRVVGRVVLSVRAH